jgi:hypothetical protein
MSNQIGLWADHNNLCHRMHRYEALVSLVQPSGGFNVFVDHLVALYVALYVAVMPAPELAVTMAMGTIFSRTRRRLVLRLARALPVEVGVG